MNILGISCYYHDSAASLIKDGKIVAAAEEERFSRLKHDPSFPKKSITFCLKKAKIKAEDLDYVVFYEKPFLKLERLLLNTLSYTPKSYSFFKESMRSWFFDKLWIKSHIMNELQIPSGKLLFCEHHLSHAASSYFCSPFEKSAILVIDAVGEWTTTSWGIGKGNKIELKEEINFPQSLGLLYSAFTHFAGFEVNEGEYKVMGLAPYGKPRYVDKIQKLLDLKNDGSYALDLNYFSYHYSPQKIYTKKFTDIFGTPKTPSDEVVSYYADIAASIQFVLEDILVKIVNHVQQKSGLETLCYAGGVALNSAANWKILNKSKFKEIFIQPAAGDSGGALGAALWAYYSILNNKKDFVLNHAYWGESESQNQIKAFLDKENIKYNFVKNEDVLIEEIVDKLSRKQVIGWVQDEFEWGPRALGHRSILADPSSHEMKDTVNSKIKFREGFRPFAPSVTLEESQNYFSVGSKKNHHPFKYMLYVVPVKKEKQEKLGAITHVDGTARPQFVNKETNSRYHKLISYYGQKTGVPVVLNTSFNLKGEPIVNTAKEAYNTFIKSGIDTLVLGKFIVNKK
ncbi:hypothetical protein C4577_00185 [Candidatus Parcubacteria bacterium]|nr:MAG: hypothetical protein C4577_00185 [Candidatus Parcubacteria bacterium]